MPPPFIEPGDFGAFSALFFQRRVSRFTRRMQRVFRRPRYIERSGYFLADGTLLLIPERYFFFDSVTEVIQPEVIRLAEPVPDLPVFRRPTLVRSVVLDCSSTGNSAATEMIPLDYVCVFAFFSGNGQDARPRLEVGWTNDGAANADFQEGDHGLWSEGVRIPLDISLMGGTSISVRSSTSRTRRRIRVRVAANPFLGGFFVCYFLLVPRVVIEAEDAAAIAA